MDHPHQIFLRSIATQAPDVLIDLFNRTRRIGIKRLEKVIAAWGEHWNLSADWILQFAYTVVTNMDRAAFQLIEDQGVEISDDQGCGIKRLTNVNLKEFVRRTWTDALNQQAALLAAIEGALAEERYKPRRKDHLKRQFEDDCNYLVLWLCNRMTDREIIEMTLNKKIDDPAFLRKEVDAMRKARKRVAELLDIALTENRQGRPKKTGKDSIS
jgi:hypothetical protein